MRFTRALIGAEDPDDIISPAVGWPNAIGPKLGGACPSGSQAGGSSVTEHQHPGGV